MPTYEYECDSCHHRFEKVQSFSADPVKECPVCEGPVRRVFFPVGIIFKGSGWYVNDSKKPNPALGSSSPKSEDKSVSAEKAEAKNPEPKQAEKTDSKPAEPAKSST
jgi:putative FmdB family regulatory protein